MRLSFDVLARDQASQVFNQVGRAAEGVSSKIRVLDKLKAVPTVTLNTAPAQAAAAAITRDLAKLQAKQITLPVNLQRIDAQAAALRAQLEKLKAERVNVAVDLRGGIDEQIKVVNADLRKLSAQRVRIPVELSRTDAAVSALQANLSRIGPVKVPVDADTAAAQGKLSALAARVSSMSTQRVRVLVEANQVAQALPLLAGLAASLSGVVAAAAPAAASVAALLPVAGALGQGFAVAKFATSGLGDAMKAVDAVNRSTAAGFAPTAAQVKKVAMEYGLTTAAGQRLVQVLLTQSAAFGTLKDRVQGVLLGQFATSINTLGTTYMPVLTRAAMGTAVVLRDLTAQATRAFSSAVWRQDVQTILTANTGLLRTLGQAAIPLAGVVRNIWVAAIPLAERFAGFVRRGAVELELLTAAGRRTGALAGFFTTAGNVAATLGRIIGNVAVTLTNLGRAAFGSGMSVLGFIEGLTGALRRLSENRALAEVAGKIVALGGTGVLLAGIAGRFVAMGVAIGRLAGYAVSLARFVGLFTPLGAAVAIVGGAFVLAYQKITPFREAVDRIGNLIRVGFAPALTALGNAVQAVFAGRFSEAAGHLGRFATAVVNGVRAVGPQIARTMLSAGAALVDWISPRIGPALVAIGGFIGRLAGWVLGTGLPTLARAAVRLGEAIVGWVGPRIGPTLTALGGFIAAAARWVVGTGLPTLGRAAANLGRSLTDWIGPRIGPALTALGGFIAAAAKWVTSTGLPTLGRAARALGTAIVDWVGPRIGPLLAELGKLIRRAADWVTGTGLPMLGRGLARLGKALWEWVEPRIPDLLGKIGNLIGRLTAWVLGTGLPRVVGALGKLSDELIAWVGPKIPPLLLEMGKLLGRLTKWVLTEGVPLVMKSLGNLGLKAVTGFVDGFKQTDLGKFITGVMGKVRGVMTSAWEGIQYVWRLGTANIKLVFANAIGAVLDGAVQMMGWVPGLGEKLRGAQAAFGTFRENVNKELQNIKDEQLNIFARYSIQQVMATEQKRDERGNNGVGRFRVGGAVAARFSNREWWQSPQDVKAAGGHRAVYAARSRLIRGPGTGTSDSIDVAAQPGGHVWTAREVSAAGGPSAMDRIMERLRQGRAPGLVRGGPVDLQVHQMLPDVGAMGVSMRRLHQQTIDKVTAQTTGIARAAAEKARKDYLTGGIGPGAVYNGAVGRASGWGARPHVAAVGKIVQRMFNLPGGIGGYRSGGGGDHPKGLALDLMTSPLGGGPRPEGNRLAGFGLANAAKFGLSYIIWAGKIATAMRGWRWSPYTRYGPLSQAGHTKFHNDHNHWSFRPAGYRALTSGSYSAGQKATPVRTGNTRALGGPVLPRFTPWTMPQLGDGGIVRATPGGSPALLAERGQDEAVIPLPRGGMKVIAGGTGRAGCDCADRTSDMLKAVQVLSRRPIYVTVEMDRRVVGRALATDADRLSRGG